MIRHSKAKIDVHCVYTHFRNREKNMQKWKKAERKKSSRERERKKKKPKKVLEK